jgi:hypothetical protein
MSTISSTSPGGYIYIERIIIHGCVEIWNFFECWPGYVDDPCCINCAWWEQPHMYKYGCHHVSRYVYTVYVFACSSGAMQLLYKTLSYFVTIVFQLNSSLRDFDWSTVVNFNYF